MSFATILQNRSFIGLLASNTLLASAFPVQLILGSLAGLMLSPSPLLATLPASIQSLAALFAAAPFSLLMGRAGRKVGFILGGFVTIIGAVIAVMALYSQSFALLCCAHFFMGAGWASFQYFRFAAGEAVDARLRPVAISLMLTSGLIAAIVGPELFVAAKDALVGVPLAGGYAALVPLSLLGLLPLVAVQITAASGGAKREGAERVSILAALRRRPAQRAIGIAAVSQGIMVFLMVPTPIAMIGTGFSEDMAGDVIRWHLIAMFAPSFFTGFLIQRFGAQTIAIVGLVTIALAAGAAATGVTSTHFYGSLVVLGMGWNFGFIGATSMLAAAVPQEEAASVQGANDSLIAFSSVIGSFLAGFVISGLGWAVLASISAAAIAIALVLFWLHSHLPEKA